jgi:hypothetical protein
VAGYRIKRLRNVVDLPLEIAGVHPNFSVVFYPNLSAAGNVACGMKRKFHPIDGKFFSVSETSDGNIFANSSFDQIYTGGWSDVVLHAPTRVIGVGMRNDGFGNRAMWIKKNIGWRTINAL